MLLERFRKDQFLKKHGLLFIVDEFLGKCLARNEQEHGKDRGWTLGHDECERLLVDQLAMEGGRLNRIGAKAIIDLMFQTKEKALNASALPQPNSSVRTSYRVWLESEFSKISSTSDTFINSLHHINMAELTIIEKFCGDGQPNGPADALCIMDQAREMKLQLIDQAA